MSDIYNPETVLGEREQYSDEKLVGVDEYGNLPLSVLGGKVKSSGRWINFRSTTCHNCKERVTFHFKPAIREGEADRQTCPGCNKPIRPLRRLAQGWIYKPMVG